MFPLFSCGFLYFSSKNIDFPLFFHTLAGLGLPKPSKNIDFPLVFHILIGLGLSKPSGRLLNDNYLVLEPLLGDPRPDLLDGICSFPCSGASPGGTVGQSPWKAFPNDNYLVLEPLLEGIF